MCNCCLKQISNPFVIQKVNNFEKKNFCFFFFCNTLTLQQGFSPIYNHVLSFHLLFFSKTWLNISVRHSFFYTFVWCLKFYFIFILFLLFAIRLKILKINKFLSKKHPKSAFAHKKMFVYFSCNSFRRRAQFEKWILFSSISATIFERTVNRAQNIFLRRFLSCERKNSLRTH